MNLFNATLAGLTAPNPPTTGGDVTYPSPTSISVRCILDGVKQSQRIALGAVIQDATAVLYVLKARLGNLKPARGQEVRVLLDGEQAAQVLVAEHVINHEKEGGLSHYQVFLKERAG